MGLNNGLSILCFPVVLLGYVLTVRQNTSTSSRCSSARERAAVFEFLTASLLSSRDAFPMVTANKKVITYSFRLYFFSLISFVLVPLTKAQKLKTVRHFIDYFRM